MDPCRRIAGNVGRCVVSLRRVSIFTEPQVLKERKGDRCQDGVMMKTEPRAAFEAIHPSSSFIC